MPHINLSSIFIAFRILVYFVSLASYSFSYKSKWILQIAKNSRQTSPQMNCFPTSADIKSVSGSSLDGYGTSRTFLRQLGTFEKLLSRRNSNSKTNAVSLSHGCVVILDESLPDSTLKSALWECIKHHQFLRVSISDSIEWHSIPLKDIDLNNVVTTVSSLSNDFDNQWRKLLENSLNGPHFPVHGPLWRVTNLVCDSSDDINRDNRRSAWIFTFNHAIDDQQSINIMVKDILSHANMISDVSNTVKNHAILPPSMEEAVCPEFFPNLKTLLWAFYQLHNSLQGPTVLPQWLTSKISQNKDIAFNKMIAEPANRRTIIETLSLNGTALNTIRNLCKQRGLTITHFLSAAVLTISSVLIQLPEEAQEEGRDTNMSSFQQLDLRLLVAIGLRNFASPNYNPRHAHAGNAEDIGNDWTNGSVACASGAVDFIVDVPKVDSLKDGVNVSEEFWALAMQCKDKLDFAVKTMDFVPESVRLFSLGWKMGLDILKAVSMEARNVNTLGRAYTCSVSNVGLVSYKSIPAVPVRGDSTVSSIRGIYYGTSQSETGVLCQLSTITVDDAFCCCLQFPHPIVTPKQATFIKEQLSALLQSF